MIWEEKFEGGQLDPERWGYDLGYFHTPGDPASWGWGNRELQYYTDSPSNSWVGDDGLHLRALPGLKAFPGGHIARFTSARLTTRGKFAFTYGRIDVTARMPAGTGIWPAIWLLPEDWAYGPWAASGEIDIAEVRGRFPDRVQGTLHFGGSWPDNQHVGGEFVFPEGQRVDTAFHTYSLIRRPDEMIWLVDDVAYYSVRSDAWRGVDPANPRAPFDRPFHLLINLAVGGAYDENREPAAGAIPAEMVVRGVRVSAQV